MCKINGVLETFSSLQAEGSALDSSLALEMDFAQWSEQGTIGSRSLLDIVLCDYLE